MAAPDLTRAAAVLVFAGASLALALLGVALPAAADDTDTGGGQDSTAAADTTSMQAAPEAGLNTAGQPLWEAHPAENFKVTKSKDVTNWDNSITLAKQLSSKLSLNLSGTVTARENSTLNKSDASNGASAILKYQLNNNITFSTTYSSNVSAYRYALSRNAPADRRKGEDVSVAGELSRKLLDAVDVNVKASGGSTSNSFQAMSNDGRRVDLTAAVSYAPGALRTSASFTGKRLFQDSRVDSGGASVFTSQDNTFSKNLALSLSYDMLPGVRLGMDASNNEDQRQHPDPAQKLQETESKKSQSASVTSSFDMWKRLTWDMAVKFNSSKNRYKLRSVSNSKSNGADLTASAKITPWRAATVSLGGEREVTRDEYVTADTGNSLHKSLSCNVSQGLGSKV
ncbi:MAG TPA: hypothetical protein VMU02_08530, partial [bacterium]|nr:hypothetical protein [bacterium]